MLVPWISEESESVRLKFESSRKLNLKEYKPLRKGIAIGGIDVFVSIIKFIFTFVGDVKKTPKPRQLSVNHQLYDRRRPRSRQRSASPLVCDRRRPRPRPRSASHPVCDTCPEICTMTRSPIHFYYRLIRLAPISNYKQCTNMVQAIYKLFAATVTVVTGVF